MSENVVITRADGVLEIRLDRPEKKNALTRAMYDAIADAFEQVDTDPTLRVALLTGTGDTFTSGNDISDFQSRAASEGRNSASRFLPTISAMQKPLIAAVNGAAVGVGTTMLMHCDLIVAARSARFVMPFTSLGLVPEAASSLLFPRLLGYQRASALLLLGEPLDAVTALQWGGGRRGPDGRHARDGVPARDPAAAGGAAHQAADPARRARCGGADGRGTRAVPRTARLARGERSVRCVHGKAQAGFFAVRLKDFATKPLR